MARISRSSRPDGPAVPRIARGQPDQQMPYQHMSHGPIIPLERPTFLERLLGRR